MNVLTTSVSILLMGVAFAFWYATLSFGWLWHRKRRGFSVYGPHRCDESMLPSVNGDRSGLEEMLHAIRFPLPWKWFVLGCIVLSAGGLSLGIYAFGPSTNCLMLTAASGTTPLLWARLRLATVRVRLRMEFLPSIEVFYQAYRNEPRRNVRVVLERITRERRMPTALQPYYHELYESMAIGGDDALRRFRYAIRHAWGHTFGNMLEAAMQEGVLLDEPLRAFIRDMRGERQQAVIDRSRLLEIRMANFSAPAFLVLFVAVNLHFNYDQSVFYYFYDPEGRELLLETGLMIFASFFMGLMLRLRSA